MGKKPHKPVPPSDGTLGSSEVVSGLAGSIAHDFSNLLMVLRNAAGFLREELEPDDPRQEHVSDLLRAADRARQLTEQLQAIGRGHLLKPEPVWPGEMLRSMADTFRHIVPADVDFRITVRSTDTPVMFDPAQLPILIMRLLSVAAERASGQSRLVLLVDDQALDRKRAALHKMRAGNYVRIMIADTHGTLEDSERDRAFEPRFAGKRAPRGTDLRVASANAIVQQSGGFMEITHERGHGPALAIWLPAALGAAPSHRPRHLQALKELRGDEVVLLVEDDEAVRNTVRKSLERYGYTVLVAADGEAALRLTQLLTQPPDLLLTDLVMPGVTGRELIESLGIEGRLPKVLMMSGYTDDDVLRRAGPSESYPFIKKPFTHQELAAKVRHVLEVKAG